MKVRLIQPKETKISQWSGGKTTQLAIMPADSQYEDRIFDWRLSSASVDLKESEFTSLPDYKRLIVMQNAAVVLQHDGGPELTLKPWQVHSFDGAARTISRGKAVDYNLMLRKDRVDGSLSVTEGTAYRGYRLEELAGDLIQDGMVKEAGWVGIYSRESDLVIRQSRDRDLLIQRGGLALLTMEAGEEIRPRSMQIMPMLDCHMIIAVIREL